MNLSESQMVNYFVFCACLLLLALSCKAKEPEAKPWPEQFNALLYQEQSGHQAMLDLWYDWPNGRSMNIVQSQLGGMAYHVEWNNGSTFNFDTEAKSCKSSHLDVGILYPGWFNQSRYVGVKDLDGFDCNVWEIADFLIYYEEIRTQRPVGWTFIGSGQFQHVMTFEVGAVLPDEVWQAPSYCFEDALSDIESGVELFVD